MKQIWDMSMYISFVFHQKSANQVIKPVENEEIEEQDDDNYSEYTSSQVSSMYDD